MTYGTVNVDSVVNSDGVTSGGLYGFKNRIINGAMMIDQRNAGASITPATDQYLTDRFQAVLTQSSKFTAQQSTTAPAGFVNSLLVTSSSAYSVPSGDFFGIRQSIEGLNVADLAWGTASAAAVTLSFWVRSSLTGTFGGSVFNSAGNRSYPFTYTISAANTWEQKSVTIAGDTTGTWLTTNGKGIQLLFGLGVGSTYSGTANTWSSSTYFAPTGATSVVGTNGATFYITGVQLEKGSTATSFDYRPYGTELALCQRYLPAFNNRTGYNPFGVGQCTSTTGAIITIPFPVTARTVPTGITTTAASTFACWQPNTATTAATGIVYATASATAGSVSVTGMSGLGTGNATALLTNNTTAQILFTGCEL